MPFIPAWSGTLATLQQIPVHHGSILKPTFALYEKLCNQTVIESHGEDVQPVPNGVPINKIECASVNDELADRRERELLSCSPDDDDAASLSDDEEELVTKRNIKCVDDVGLETEECFIE